MDFSHFDTRHYPTLSVREGYSAWVQTYEATVQDEMDLRLLNRIDSIAWPQQANVIDLACGTGRIGAWLERQGVSSIDGVDMTPDMLELARQRNIYRQLIVADIGATGLPSAAYSLAIMSLADEHLSTLAPVYQEAYRLIQPRGHFVLVGYHPYFLMGGVPTHFDRAPGEPVAIESYIHLTSDHIKHAFAAGWSLVSMDEGLIDDDWIAKKPKWAQYRNRPISFSFVWRK